MAEVDPPLRVLHITPRLTRAAGGAWHYVEGLTRSLERVGVRCTVVGVVDRGSADHESLASSQTIVGVPSILPANYGFSRELSRRIDRELGHVDVVHAHGFRVGTDLLAARVARRFNAPLLISPHGQLHPSIAQRGGLRKRIINSLWANRYLRRADAVLAVGETESAVVRAAAPTKLVATLPIGVDVAAYGRPRGASDASGITSIVGGNHVALYLAHMHANKGLTRLADAWLTMFRERPDWHLVLAGFDVAGLGAATAARMRAAGAGDSFTLLGPLFGDAKLDAFAQADLFTMPSDAESFGIAFAEALASSVPIIATRGAPWSSVVDHRCGWWIEPTVDALTAALREATAISDEDRRAMGERGRALVAEQFDWTSIAMKVRQLYEWLLRRGDKPAFVTGA